MGRDTSRLIHRHSGIDLDLGAIANDPDAQLLVAAFLGIAAKSDGAVSTEEVIRMSELLKQGFDIGGNEALSLITSVIDGLGTGGKADELLLSINQRLKPKDKEELLFMALQVIAADGIKDSRELGFLYDVVELMKIPESAVERAFKRHNDLRERR